jgi:acyl carrier protein
MTQAEFIEEFALLLDVPVSALRPETELGTIPTWDSVAYLGTMVLIDENLGIALRAETLARFKTINDMLTAINSSFTAA